MEQATTEGARAVSVQNYKKSYPAALKVAKAECADIRQAKDKANAASAIAESVASGVIRKSDIRKMDTIQTAALDALGL
jgi:hypothetical protein